MTACMFYNIIKNVRVVVGAGAVYVSLLEGCDTVE
jgi:hypothetical protein